MMREARLLKLPEAPGLWLCAGLVGTPGGPRSATGTGWTPGTAQARMRSEAAEALAVDGPRTGVAAAASPGAASRAALLELVEQHGAALWWAGVHPARAPGPAARRAFTRGLALAGAKPDRRRGLLDVGLPGLPPVILAWSCGADGLGAALGLACRPVAAAAAMAALRELAQMEFGLALALRRAAAGRPNRADAGRLDRAAGWHLPSDPRMRPARGPLSAPLSMAPRAWLAAAGMPVRLTELPCPDPDRHVIRAAWRTPCPPPEPAGWPLRL